MQTPLAKGSTLVKTNKQPASRQDPQAPRKVLVVNPKASFMFPGTEPPLIYAEVRSLIDCAAGVLPASPATEARVLPASPATEVTRTYLKIV
jgi:hypothetical protein